MRYELGDKIGAYTLPATAGTAAPATSGAPAGKVDQKAHYQGTDPGTGAVSFALDPIDPATNPLASVHVVWVPVNTPLPATAQQFMVPHLHRSSVPVASNGATAGAPATATPAATAPAAPAAPMTPTQPAAAAPATTTLVVPVNPNVQRGVPYIAQAIHEYTQ